MKREKYTLWLLQAENDLVWCEHTFKSKCYAQVCFISQQVAEKSLKALAFFRGFDMIRGHSIFKIASELKINGEIIKAAKKLDLYYLSSRYPDAIMDEMVPFEYFEKDEAEDALSLAKQVFEKVRGEIEAGNG
jgi:HEPN domain-containing protein